MGDSVLDFSSTIKSKVCKVEMLTGYNDGSINESAPSGLGVNCIVNIPD